MLSKCETNEPDASVSHLKFKLKKMKTYDPKDDADNHANQLNPNNDAYYQSRGYDDYDDYLDSNRNDDDDDYTSSDDDYSSEIPASDWDW